jgi:hypothetical protein
MVNLAPTIARYKVPLDKFEGLCSQIRASEVTSTVRSEESFGQLFEAHVDKNNCVLFFFGKMSTQSVGTNPMRFLHNTNPFSSSSNFVDKTVLDTFRRLPSAGYLVSVDCEPEWRVAPFSSILSHFAKTRRTSVEC